MANIYTYNLSHNFNNDCNATQLHQEIKDAVNTEILSINITGDSMDIYFRNTLSFSEHTILTNIINSHKPNMLVYTNIVNLPIDINPIKEEYYVSITSFLYSTNKNIVNIKIYSYMEDNGESYNIRLININNNKLIFEQQFSNTDDVCQEINNINNLPLEDSLFELQCKVNANTIAHVKSLIIYYN